MTRLRLLRTCAAAPLAAAYAQPRFQPTWESLDARPSPSWYTDAKFGIFIHWGLYSVPSYAPLKQKGETMYAEWYWNSLTKGQQEFEKTGHGNHTWDFHVKNYGRDFPYQNFAPMFRAEMFDPE